MNRQEHLWWDSPGQDVAGRRDLPGVRGPAFVAAGQTGLIALGSASAGYRPVHIVVIIVAFLLIILASGEVAWFGLRNRAVIERERAQRALVEEATAREEDFRRQAAARGHVEGSDLPDPDLRLDPSGASYFGSPTF